MNKSFNVIIFLLCILLISCSTTNKVVNNNTNQTENKSLFTDRNIDEIKIIGEYYAPSASHFSNYSRITMEDFLSGNLLIIEKEWVEKNPFLENAIPITNLYFHTRVFYYPYYEKNEENQFQIEITDIRTTISHDDYSDPKTRPFKIVSFYVVWDKDLFEKLKIHQDSFPPYNKKTIGENQRSYGIGLMSWAWLNPDRTTRIGHSIVLMYNTNLDGSSLLLPIVDTNNLYEKESFDFRFEYYYMLNKIYDLYPDLNPYKYALDWVKTNNLPEEAEKCLFGISNYLIPW